MSEGCVGDAFHQLDGGQVALDIARRPWATAQPVGEGRDDRV